MAEGQITVWCLLGRKAGDNTQVLALAQELGFGYVEKHILARPWELLTHIRDRGTLAGINRTASSPLQAPWPDLVLSAGRRNEPVAQWIRQCSGGHSRLVHIGRPWSALASWDLIVTTPQYFLPQRSNIHHNTLPLHRMSSEELSAAGVALQPQLHGMPRPWIAVLLGGDSGQFVFTANKGARLGRLCNELAAAAGGSLLLTDSPRTPRVAGDALQAQLTVTHRYHRWGASGDNPYRGLLALADAFVVTGESMSMLGEACSMRKPLYIFDMGDGQIPWWRLPHAYRYKPLSHRLAMRCGPQRMRRDVGRMQDALVDNGSASWLTEEVVKTAAALPVARQKSSTAVDDHTRRELARTAAAVRQLVIPH